MRTRAIIYAGLEGGECIELVEKKHYLKLKNAAFDVIHDHMEGFSDEEMDKFYETSPLVKALRELGELEWPKTPTQS